MIRALQHSQTGGQATEPRSDFADQPKRHSRKLMSAAVALTVGLTLASASVGEATPKKSTPSTAYRRFTSCDAFLKYVRPIALDRVGPYGFDQFQVFYPTVKRSPDGTVPAAAPVAAAPVAEVEVLDSKDSGTSTTNTQEAGVDEGDIVETDGTFVYASIGRFVFVTNALAGKLVAKIELPVNSNNAELILDGKRLAIVTSVYSNVGPESVVSVYDVTNPEAPIKLSTTHLEGQALAVRSVDHRARLVLSTQFGQRIAQKFPQYIRAPQTPAEIKKATEINKKIVRTSPASDWLPRTYSEQANGAQGPVTQALTCGEVGRPKDSSGLGLTWIATIDLDTPSPLSGARGSAGVVAQGGTVYASADTIYVSTQKWFSPNGTPNGRTAQRAGRTEIHAFDMRPADGAAWLASGSFTGSLLNQFSMSEYNGALRVATTRFDAGFGGDATSGVQTLMLDSKDRRKLITVGELWGLGTNENIYSVRFVGAQGYVVTFRQTDPLYVLDLTEPRSPRLVGELKIPGYSSYLHPIGDGLLVGIGQNATDQGRVTGSQASLFDVSNPANPVRLATLDLGSQSGAEYDHRAFLWWASTRDLILPTVTYPYSRDGKQQKYGSGAIVARVGVKGAATLTSRGIVSHDSKVAIPPNPTQSAPPNTTPPPSTNPSGVTPAPAPAIAPPPFFQLAPVVRSLIVSGRLVTVSVSGLMNSDLSTLAESSWVSFF